MENLQLGSCILLGVSGAIVIPFWLMALAELERWIELDNSGWTERAGCVLGFAVFFWAVVAAVLGALWALGWAVNSVV